MTSITSIDFIEFLQAKLPKFSRNGAVSKTRDRFLEKELKSGKRDLLICVDLLIPKRRASSLMAKLVNACHRFGLCVSSVEVVGQVYMIDGKQYQNYRNNKAILHFKPHRFKP